MQKLALCIKRDSASIDFNETDVQPIPEGFFGDQEFMLLDRALVETDPSFLQLIPYIVLRNTEGRIFCYERGAAGAENRLHSKLSIGLGGHVDTAQGEAYIVNHLLAEGERELLEEVGIDGELMDFEGLIFAGVSGDSVDQVHLGLYTEYRMREMDEIASEKDVITKGRFLTLAEVLLPETFDRLEPWSQSVALEMQAKQSKLIGQLFGDMGNLVSLASIESPTGLTSSAAQEVGAALDSVGSNLDQGHALAKVYDDGSANFDIDELANTLRGLQFSLGNPSMRF